MVSQIKKKESNLHSKSLYNGFKTVEAIQYATPIRVL